jgi:uncharacterized protein YqgC (DUF456 family)
MNNKKTTSIVLLVSGVILLLASLTADMIGIGQAAGFGYKQMIGSAAGVIAAVVGFVIKPKS